MLRPALTEVTLRCVPAFTLQAVEDTAPLGEVLEALPERVTTHDHYEFYWFPYADRCLTKANTRRAGPPDRPLPRRRTVVEDEVLSNGAFAVLNEVGRLRPRWVPGLDRLAARALSRREYDDASSRVFASRYVRGPRGVANVTPAAPSARNPTPSSGVDTCGYLTGSDS